jgi:PAS domain S-box-containing protein
MLMLPDYRVRQRDFLLEISRAITAQLDLDEVLKRILHASVVMLTGQSGLIALRAPDGKFYINATSAIKEEAVPALHHHLHDLTSGQKAMDAESFEAKLDEMAQEIDEHLQQSVALPLTFADEPLGLMIVFRGYHSAASINDMQVLGSFANQAAIAVHNAQLYKEIDQERNRLAAILQHGADGVMILDANCQILRFNRALERMTGYKAHDAIGRYQDQVLEWDKVEHGDLRLALEGGWPFVQGQPEEMQDTHYVEGDLRRRDGVTVSVGITYAPLLSANGELDNIIANVRDITNFRRAQQMQNMFISVISHELKTPVAIIKGYAATLRRTDASWDTKVIQDNLAVIEEEADRLNSLIQDLLTASKLQAQSEMSLDVTKTRLNSLCERAVERFHTQSSKHQILHCFPHNFPEIVADEAKLRQVIDNLLGNAIKYSPDGGIIEVGGSFDEQTVTVYVRDCGAGITDDDQKHVFDRFYRVDGKLSRKTQGTGLGLYLSRAIVQAHKGTISVESEPGRGSTFYFSIPRFYFSDK